MAEWCLPIAAWIDSMSSIMDRRQAHCLSKILMGLLFATGRKTFSRWLVFGGVSGKLVFKPFYYFLGSLGRRVERVAMVVLRQVVIRTAVKDRVLMAIDDSPTKRYGPKVEGAGVHHNPTPGPADHKYVYGHIWCDAGRRDSTRALGNHWSSDPVAALHARQGSGEAHRARSQEAAVQDEAATGGGDDRAIHRMAEKSGD